MNDVDDYYRTLDEDRRLHRRLRRTDDQRGRADAVDRAAAAIGEPLSPPDVDHV